MNPVQLTNLVRFVMGCEIIRRYQLNAEMSANNGFVYVGDYQTTFNQMTDSEKETMELLGWVEGDRYWSFFTHE